MELIKHSFDKMRITVMGLGLLGRGVGDAKYLAQCGAELIVTDLKSHDELEESVKQLAEFPNVQFVLGEHRLEDFRNRDLILKSAGVPLNSQYIAQAKKDNIPVRMSADLFMELSGISVIGITGTRGKSTVAHLVYTILQEAKIPVVLGGNILGVSTLALLPKVTVNHMAVLELDSWQCQGLGEAEFSPHIAVFTTFYSDHLNYYKDDPGQYLTDKSNIFLYQDPDDTLIMGSQCAPTLIEAYGENIIAKTLVVDETKLPNDWKLMLPGVHNRYNAAIALSTARAIGIEDKISRQAIENFKGVPGRLELITKKNNIRIYNDTTATTPEATIAALSALGVDNTILIMGGADKGLDMSALLSMLSNVKHIVLLEGTGTECLHKELPDARVCNSLHEAVQDAFAHATSGDSILFSPAFASFGMFKNEFDRGDQFVKLIQGKLT